MREILIFVFFIALIYMVLPEDEDSFVPQAEQDTIQPIVRNFKPVENKQKPKNKNPGFPALSQAYRDGRPDLADELIKNGANLQATDDEGGTPLHHAVAFADISSVRYLLNLGASTNEVNHLGQTPLHLAVELGRIDLVKLLIEHGADVKLVGKDTEALPVFLTAVLYNYRDIVEVLVESDKSILATRDQEGRDAVVLALRYGHTILADQLREMGVPTEL